MMWLVHGGIAEVPAGAMFSTAAAAETMFVSPGLGSALREHFSSTWEHQMTGFENIYFALILIAILCYNA